MVNQLVRLVNRMKKTTATLKGIPLTLHLAESKDEKTAGYNSVPIRDGEGMLFQFPEIHPGNVGWIPVDVSGLDKKLDILFLDGGRVRSIRQRAPDDGSDICGEGNAMLELPAGFVEKNGIVVGDGLCFDFSEYVTEPKDKIDLQGAKKEELDAQMAEALVFDAPPPKKKR